MLVSDVKPESGITISVGIGMQVLEFNTVVKEVYDGIIYAAPIMQNGKMIGFSTPGLVLSMILPDPEEAKAYKFMNIHIRNIKTPNGDLFHEISCKTEGKLINRRGACRVWLGESGVATIGLGGKPFDVTIKDISISGIGFICSSDVVVEEGSVVHVSFYDEPTKSRFSLGAIIVRMEDMDRGRMLYGCRLNQESNAVAKFVNDKQREKLRAARQSHAQPLTR